MKSRFFALGFTAALWSCACFPGVAARAAAPTRFAWEILPAREVHPEGWLKVQWAEDFASGLPSRLDVINADVTHRLFAGQETEIKFPGRPTWWPGDSETYWMESYVHGAFQVGDAAQRDKATRYVEDILRAQGPDGYLGIYGPDSRLLPAADPRYGQGSGELNTQAHAFLTLLAFHEHTGRADVLQAVERAAKLDMSRYANGVFGETGEITPRSGGNSHAVAFIDAMAQLYRLTGDESYLRFMETMYASYHRFPPRDHDLQRDNLADPAGVFRGHGAHTAESFHWLAAMATIGGDGSARLADAAMAKLGRQLTPGGALISDEMIDGRLGNGHDLYEYCTQAELIKSLTWIAQYRGDVLAAERAARLYLNASMGARLHPLGALQYLSRDDRLDIPTNARKEPSNIRNDGSHFQMSSIIRPACCPGSAGRPVHYYLSSSWMKRPDGGALALMNLMPSSVSTELAAGRVAIVEETDYPFSDVVRLRFQAAPDQPFPLAIRLPLEGSIAVKSLAGLTQDTRDGFLWLTRRWRAGDVVELALELPTRLEQSQEGGAWFYRRGSLTFGLPFQATVAAVAENPDFRSGQPGGLFEYDIRVPDKSAWGYRLAPGAAFAPVTLGGDARHPWQGSPLGLRGTMLNGRGEKVEVTLVPEAAAVSRRVTFLDQTHSAEEAAKLPAHSEVSLGH